MSNINWIGSAQEANFFVGAVIAFFLAISVLFLYFLIGRFIVIYFINNKKDYDKFEMIFDFYYWPLTLFLYPFSAAEEYYLKKLKEKERLNK